MKHTNGSAAKWSELIKPNFTETNIAPFLLTGFNESEEDTHTSISKNNVSTKQVDELEILLREKEKQITLLEADMAAKTEEYKFLPHNRSPNDTYSSSCNNNLPLSLNELCNELNYSNLIDNELSHNNKTVPNQSSKKTKSSFMDHNIDLYRKNDLKSPRLHTVLSAHFNSEKVPAKTLRTKKVSQENESNYSESQLSYGITNDAKVVPNDITKKIDSKSLKKHFYDQHTCDSHTTHIKKNPTCQHNIIQDRLVTPLKSFRQKQIFIPYSDPSEAELSDTELPVFHSHKTYNILKPSYSRRHPSNFFDKLCPVIGDLFSTKKSKSLVVSPRNTQCYYPQHNLNHSEMTLKNSCTPYSIPSHYSNYYSNHLQHHPDLLVPIEPTDHHYSIPQVWPPSILRRPISFPYLYQRNPIVSNHITNRSSLTNPSLNSKMIPRTWIPQHSPSRPNIRVTPSSLLKVSQSYRNYHPQGTGPVLSSVTLKDSEIPLPVSHYYTVNSGMSELQSTNDQPLFPQETSPYTQHCSSLTDPRLHCVKHDWDKVFMPDSNSTNYSTQTKSETKKGQTNLLQDKYSQVIVSEDDQNGRQTSCTPQNLQDIGTLSTILSDKKAEQSHGHASRNLLLDKPSITSHQECIPREENSYLNKQQCIQSEHTQSEQHKTKSCYLESSPIGWEATKALQRFPNIPIKKAFCVGVETLQKTCELKGAINDAIAMKQILTEPPYNFVTRLLVDTPSQLGGSLGYHDSPTKQNILSGLEWLLYDCKEGDILLWYFSGCSARLQDSDQLGVGEDALVPCDFGFRSYNSIDSVSVEPLLLYSTDIHDMLRQHLKPGIQFIGIFDTSFASTLVPVSATLSYVTDWEFSLRVEKPPLLRKPSPLWLRWSKSDIRCRTLNSPLGTAFFRTSSFKGFYEDPLRLGAMSYTTRLNMPSVFIFEACSNGQEAKEAIIDGISQGILTCCLIRALKTLKDLTNVSVGTVFQTACRELDDLKKLGNADFESIDQTFILGFSRATPPSMTHLFKNTKEEEPISLICSQLMNIPFSPNSQDIPTAADSGALTPQGRAVSRRVIGIIVSSALSIKTYNIIQSLKYYVAFGFYTGLIQDMNDTTTWMPPIESQTSRVWGTKDNDDPRYDECDFQMARVVLERSNPRVQRYLVVSLWSSPTTGDRLIGRLIVDIEDNKLFHFQRWLLRNTDGRPTGTLAFKLVPSYHAASQLTNTSYH